MNFYGQIFDLLRNGRRSVATLAVLTGRSENTIKNEIAVLVKEGSVRRVSRGQYALSPLPNVLWRRA